MTWSNLHGTFSTLNFIGFRGGDTWEVSSVHRALGLDTHKADWLCDQAAARYGGVVAPTQGYHVHESGFHARWLDDVVGDLAGGLAGMPPHVICQQFLFQLRAFRNAGFSSVIAVTGHGGGSERDLAAWAQAFTDRFGLAVEVTGDMMLSTEPGDHAGKFEISALASVRPDLVDLTRLDRMNDLTGGGRLALGSTAAAATPEYGALIMQQALDALGPIVDRACPMRAEAMSPTQSSIPITFAQVDQLYEELFSRRVGWVSSSPSPGQASAPAGSRWRSGEYPYPGSVPGDMTQEVDPT